MAHDAHPPAPADLPPGLARLAHLHRDERGIMSLLSVFALLVLVMILGMVMNVGRQVDGKIRMQNTADAVTYSGAVTLARGMNNLAFTNHLLCEIFAMTAYLREGRDRHSDEFVPEILNAWNKAGQVLAKSGFAKFNALGAAIQQKTPLEQNLVQAFSDYANATSQQVLPLMEEILAEHMLPDYQQAVIAVYPQIAQATAMEIARRNMPTQGTTQQIYGSLWRASGQLVGGNTESNDRSLPVVQPEKDQGQSSGTYLFVAQQQRSDLAYHYLRLWNNYTLSFFDSQAKMCQFANLWRTFTCGQLTQLLTEFPDTNLVTVIARDATQITDPSSEMRDHYSVIGVAYRHQLPQASAMFFQKTVFDNPADADTVTYAEARFFVPRRRLVWLHIVPGSGGGNIALGGVPGNIQQVPGDNSGGASGAGYWVVGREGNPWSDGRLSRKYGGAESWTVLMQNWTAQLAPATESTLGTILATVPNVQSYVDVPTFDTTLKLPNLKQVDGATLSTVSPH